MSILKIPQEHICKNMFSPGQRHIAIDIETLGNTKTAAVFAIGWAIFSIEEGIVNTDHVLLEMSEAMELGTKDASTTQLLQGNLEKFKMQCNGTVKFKDAMTYLATIFASYNVTHAWGNGPDFDMVIIEDKCIKTGAIIPWKFWNVHSVRTIKAMFGELDRKDDGKAHLAQYDAEYEAEVILHGLRFMQETQKKLDVTPLHAMSQSVALDIIEVQPIHVIDSASTPATIVELAQIKNCSCNTSHTTIVDGKCDKCGLRSSR